ncbi:MAG TPA: AAA family ATPase, partial [Candidatus Nanopelagicales bacterium]|nr:AAA family ATPase [Candidatus Nanopelagicales bacterium]
FRLLRERDLEYVDKTALLCELIDRAGLQVVLLPRPRRFGKTLNLSMLRCFFERRDEDLSHLFAGLRVWEAGDAGDTYRRHFQQYPVISLTFKDLKYDRFDLCWQGIQEKIRALYDAHRDVLRSGALSDLEAQRFRMILDGTAGRILYDRALGDLSHALHRAHARPVVILIDEYDTPLHQAYLHAYAPQLLEFFRAFFGDGLKGNPHLFKAVLTGILRVARESLFSGLNNLAVFSLLRPELGACFGFTEPEVEALLDRAGRRDHMDIVRAWYDGYDFGGNVIYNPWSVLSFLDQRDPTPQPFWVSTSSNDLLRDILIRRAARLGPALERLLEGESLEREIDEHVVLSELPTSDDAFWSLLLFSGYLKAERRLRGPDAPPTYRLAIPNREVWTAYRSIFRDWLRTGLSMRGGSLEALMRALLQGDEVALEAQLQAVAEGMLSYLDGAGPAPEQFYHGFVLGLLSALTPEYRVRSNRESGKGRPDVLIWAAEPGKPAAALELKVARPGKRMLERALSEGLRQIRDNDYTAELRALGA